MHKIGTETESSMQSELSNKIADSLHEPNISVLAFSNNEIIKIVIKSIIKFDNHQKINQIEFAQISGVFIEILLS